MNAKELNFAYKVRHALNEHIDTLPVATTDHLAAARKLALARKKPEQPSRVRVTQAVLAGQINNLLDAPLSWLGKIGVIGSLLIGGLVFIGMYEYEQQQRIAETAEIDAAVLSDDLPLTAYTDRGFNAYLAKRDE
jgi:hypothetical protein